MAAPGDINAVIGGLLQDLAALQSDKQKAFAYKRAAAVVFALDASLAAVSQIPKIPGLGPSSMRVVHEVLDSGGSPTVDAAIEASGRREDIAAKRALRDRFLSRAEVIRINRDRALKAVSAADCKADFQIHSQWSDGSMSLTELVEGCLARGHTHAAVTDHSRGLPIAGGMSTDEVGEQHRAIASLNKQYGRQFRLLRGIEANIGSDGALDIGPEEIAQFEMVLAAPHSQLRVTTDQTARLLKAIDTPGVHILAHPRGRVIGTRAGVSADWKRVFAHAAKARVAIEIDGDPSRQDLDHVLARQAHQAGCLIAVDSDAHNDAQLAYADSAIAHARLAGIPANDIVNCWPLDRLLAWSRDRQG
jgi:histidinol phosphatase-like PHP family hydrolase